jgi:hypothetical protein
LEELAAFWENSRSGPDEKFELQYEIIAVEGRMAVVMITVAYEQDEPDRWRDLWVLRFDEQDLCCSFEEWPFSPDQDDGHHLGLLEKTDIRYSWVPGKVRSGNIFCLLLR